jgi:CBS domain-containing protein
MRIADIHTRRVVHIGATASVREAAELMRTRHVGALVVVEEKDGERIPVGMVTDRDIVLAVVAPGVNVEALTVGDVMTRPVVTCREDQDLFAAIELMRERGVRRLPVLNAKGSLAGVIAADDIYNAIGTHMRELSLALAREQVHEMQRCTTCSANPGASASSFSAARCTVGSR